MFRQIIIPKNTELLLQIPQEFVGHQVEVIAFTTDEKTLPIIGSEKRKYTMEEIKAFYEKYSVDFSKIEKWNREDLYDR